MKPILLILIPLVIASCSQSSNLSSNLYDGYWAMSPVDNLYRSVKFNKNGTVDIYDYNCNESDKSYTLNAIENYSLTKINNTNFYLSEDNQSPFAKFSISSLTSNTLRAKQIFINDEIIPSINLKYTRSATAKPICVFN
ncbi:hypothetical protein [Otariodibacter oris]|uniref:Lipoprotein n=1 Tax=Otariodibacter oris TaxID=1032623 RepID=A0A420XHZ7_9PAST|nr:hypothetical protein [Otariodibacter oris]QGM80862.1 hypothetical protein A6A10_05330 [Otariodibacter oris]RKR76965.1 hypothetical protein DES31_0276 [Otariodibacter oris]